MKMLLNFFRNLSVSWKFASAYFAILVIQVILSGFYLYAQTSNSAIKQASLVMEQNLLQVRESILQKEKSIENASAILAYDLNIQSFLGFSYENEIEQLEEYQFNVSPLVEHILKQNNIINSIRVYMSDNIVAEEPDSYYSISNRSDSYLYKHTLSQKPVKEGWTSTREGMTNMLSTKQHIDEQVLTYARRVVSTSNYRDTGMLEIEVKENILFSMLRDPIVNKFGKIFVVDNKNTIISDNIPELFMQDVFKSGLKDFSISSKLNTVGKVNNVNSITITIPINEINCSIVGVFPVSNFNNEVKDSFTNIILVLIAGSLLLGIIIFATTTALLGRIKKMVRAIKQVKDGNLNVSVEVKTHDEFGELGLSFNHMTSRIHDLVETVYKIQLLEREAELKALEAQINPHFLYNTLATISWAARKVKSPEIENISNSLAKFYRLVLSKGSTEISVKEELEMLKAYLNIQKMRFEDMFDVIYDIDESIYDNKMIKSILQPIVENALSHGIEPKRGHGTIIIKAYEISGQLFFKIIDDGVGMTEDTLNDILAGNVEKSSGSGYAIKNIMERLKACYGIGQSFEIYSRPGIGTVVTILIVNNKMGVS